MRLHFFFFASVPFGDKSHNRHHHQHQHSHHPLGGLFVKLFARCAACCFFFFTFCSSSSFRSQINLSSIIMCSMYYYIPLLDNCRQWVLCVNNSSSCHSGCHSGCSVVASARITRRIYGSLRNTLAISSSRRSRDHVYPIWNWLFWLVLFYIYFGL